MDMYQIRLDAVPEALGSEVAKRTESLWLTVWSST